MEKTEEAKIKDIYDNLANTSVMIGELKKVISSFKPTIYNKTDELPEWAKPTIQKLISNDILKGDEQGRLRLTDTLLRVLVINDRAGVYDK